MIGHRSDNNASTLSSFVIFLFLLIGKSFKRSKAPQLEDLKQQLTKVVRVSNVWLA